MIYLTKLQKQTKNKIEYKETINFVNFPVFFFGLPKL